MRSFPLFFKINLKFIHADQQHEHAPGEKPGLFVDHNYKTLRLLLKVGKDDIRPLTAAGMTNVTF